MPKYNSESQALADFRMDPAPASVRARLTADQALAVAKGSATSTSGTRIVVRFGTFVGNLVNVGNDANHTLQGSTRVTGIPAWIVVTYGVELEASMPTPCPIPPGAAAVVIGDSDGKELANLSGGDFATLD